MGFRSVLPQYSLPSPTTVQNTTLYGKSTHLPGSSTSLLQKKLHYYYRFSDRLIDRHGVLPKRVRIIWDWEDPKNGDSGWPAAQPIHQNPGSEGLIRFRHRIDQAILITDYGLINAAGCWLIWINTKSKKPRQDACLLLPNRYCEKIFQKCVEGRFA
jgi:hypothetical protein